MSYTISDFRRDMRYGPYAWPGGYPRFFVCSDGEPLSFGAAKENLRLILEAIRDHDGSGWDIVGCDINWEDDALFCAHTGERIAPAYSADPPEDKPVPGIDFRKEDR
jgi:hypothetical protein